MNTGERFYTVEITTDTIEPALTGTVFDLMRTQARALGLADVGHIYVHIKMEFSGRAAPGDIEELEARLEALWLGQVTKVQTG